MSVIIPIITEYLSEIEQSIIIEPTINGLISDDLQPICTDENIIITDGV